MKKVIADYPQCQKGCHCCASLSLNAPKRTFIVLAALLFSALALATFIWCAYCFQATEVGRAARLINAEEGIKNQT